MLEYIHITINLRKYRLNIVTPLLVQRWISFCRKSTIADEFSMSLPFAEMLTTSSESVETWVEFRVFRNEFMNFIIAVSTLLKHPTRTFQQLAMWGTQGGLNGHSISLLAISFTTEFKSDFPRASQSSRFSP